MRLLVAGSLSATGNYEETGMVDLHYYKKPLSRPTKEEKFTEALFMLGAENISTSTDLA